MVGIPKSNRCTFCKLRKTKVSPYCPPPLLLSFPFHSESDVFFVGGIQQCDENWPTCGACSRAGKVCSGARNNFKFVVNGCHNEAPTTTATVSTPRSRDYSVSADDASNVSSGEGGQGSATTIVHGGPLSRRTSPGGTIIVDMKEYTAASGTGTFHRMRLSRPHRPRHLSTNGGGCGGKEGGGRSGSGRSSGRPTPTPSPSPSPIMSPSELLTARYVSCLEAARGTGNDLLIWGPSMRLIPKRLGSESPVLRHAVELVVTTWTNSQREAAPEAWLDLRLYTQALGSLQQALKAPEQSYVTDIIAAQAMLQKVELAYDFERGTNEERHATGLIAMISRGGPWQGFHDLSLQLTFDTYYNMLQSDVRLGRDSVFMQNEWSVAFKQAIESSTLSRALKSLYRIWVEATAWPTLARLVRQLHQDRTDTMTAAELLLRATSVLEFLEAENETTFKALTEAGDIAEVASYLEPDLFPTCYRFRDADTAKLFYTHALLAIIVSRTLQEANVVLENYAPALMKRCREYSRRIWMSYPYMRTQRPLAVEYTAALAFAYESANEEERAFCVRSLEDMEYFRRPPPIGRWIEATIMANVKGYTGRVPFIKSQDVTVELCGLGCRS
ncbi:hypothetical protein GGR52DRAFT_376043 [Hypoxylon sp. FL1284]|nr:hypothetical protein GGR52DRAFT_376043 [Hypoxylon sp. FL1284]